MICTTVSMVIGSWGSYNACNERALGSDWLDLSSYVDWEDIEAELKKQGFKLDGIDEDLFIQDIEGIESSSTNWDYENPKRVFKVLYESGIFDNDSKYTTMQAYIEMRGFDDFCDLVDNKGCHWDDEIYIFKGFSWEDYGNEMFDCLGYQCDDHIRQFIDFDVYGKYIGDDRAEEYSGGIIEIAV